MATYPRTPIHPLEQIDKRLLILRKRMLDSVRGSTKWKAAWEEIDQLLDERLKIISEGK